MKSTQLLAAVAVALASALHPSAGSANNGVPDEDSHLNFPVTCHPGVQEAFNRAMVLRSNLFCDPAIKAFNEVLAPHPPYAIARQVIEVPRTKFWWQQSAARGKVVEPPPAVCVVVDQAASRLSRFTRTCGRPRASLRSKSSSRTTPSS